MILLNLHLINCSDFKLIIKSMLQNVAIGCVAYNDFRVCKRDGHVVILVGLGQKFEVVEVVDEQGLHD